MTDEELEAEDMELAETITDAEIKTLYHLDPSGNHWLCSYALAGAAKARAICARMIRQQRKT